MQSAEELLKEMDSVYPPINDCEYELYTKKIVSLIRARDREIVESLMGNIKKRASWCGDLTYNDIIEAGKEVLRDLG